MKVRVEHMPVGESRPCWIRLKSCGQTRFGSFQLRLLDQIQSLLRPSIDSNVLCHVHSSYRHSRSVALEKDPKEGKEAASSCYRMEVVWKEECPRDLLKMGLEV